MNGDIKKQLLCLNKMSKRSVALYHGVALSVGVSDSTLGVLYALLDADGVSQYDLCSYCSVPKQTVNSAVASLQKKGLVSLTPVPGGRNKKNVALTELGREFAERTVGRLREAELCALGGLSPEERELYVRLNEKYNLLLAQGIKSIYGKPKRC